MRSRKRWFHGLVCHFEAIFGLLTSKKCDFSEIVKAMFHMVARHCVLIFCLLSRPKCNLGEADKAMFLVFEWYFEDILYF